MSVGFVRMSREHSGTQDNVEHTVCLLCPKSNLPVEKFSDLYSGQLKGIGEQGYLSTSGLS